MHEQTLLDESVAPLLREQEPNFLRLYLNPHVARTCYCLDRYVRSTWPAAHADEECQSFLANGLDEALGGAIKLLRSARSNEEGASTGLIFDPSDRLVGFAGLDLADGSRVEFLPGLRVVGGESFRSARFDGNVDEVDLLVIVAGDSLDALGDDIRRIASRGRASIVICVDRTSLAAIRRGENSLLREIRPDVVVFDESFVDRAVPFAAFTAWRSLFAAWNRPGKSTFHSTTFQPNTISTRHFMNRLAAADPEFVRGHVGELDAIGASLSARADAFRRYYNPSLLRLIRASGFETKDVQALGPYVVVNGRHVLDLVGGVACSVRGHNPPSFAREVDSTLPADEAPEIELRDRLRGLTGLGHVFPAVSGATAVENALKIALSVQSPRRHVLVLKAGFGGKTLFSLTGTANPAYKQGVGPLYADVLYVDPFATDAKSQLDAVLESHAVAAVLVELIQSVGGVRRIPESLVRHIDESRARRGFLLLVDEVQTGMFRTGPFTQSETFGLRPDLLLLGKGTSDMMFPFALTLCSDDVTDRLAERGPALAESIRGQYAYPAGFATTLNVLRRAEEIDLSSQVVRAGERLSRRLDSALKGLPAVREVRVYGLLFAVELQARSLLSRWLGKRMAALYLLAMLRHESYPLLAGFCQYEPNTLKITPPLDAGDDVIDRACDTIADVLGRPLHRVLLGGLRRLLRPSPIRKGSHEPRNDPALELAAR